jgi:hypothetical protein
MPAGNTYEEITNQTLTSAAASVTFSSISTSYTDLVLICNPSMSTSTNQPIITLNYDTGTNYSTTSLRGDGSSAASSRHTNIAGWYPVPGPGVGTNGNPEPWIVQFMNYKNATTNKTALSRFNNASSIVSANVHLWRNTSIISTITITMESGNFNAGSTFALYGIAAA